MDDGNDEADWENDEQDRTGLPARIDEEVLTTGGLKVSEDVAVRLIYNTVAIW